MNAVFRVLQLVTSHAFRVDNFGVFARRDALFKSHREISERTEGMHELGQRIQRIFNGREQLKAAASFVTYTLAKSLQKLILCRTIS